MLDPAAYTPAYDHALCTALAAAGADVELATAPFPYGGVPSAHGYQRIERFYTGLTGAAGSTRLRAARAVRHVPDRLAWRRSARGFDLVHAQWLVLQGIDVRLLPRGCPVVMTAHDVLPREPRPGQVRAQARLWHRADAVVVHSEHGRRRLVDAVGVSPDKVEVIPHGPFDHLAAIPDPMPLPPELGGTDGPVVLAFGLMRPYKGLDDLVDAWQGVKGATLWIVGRPRMDISGLMRRAPGSVRFLTRFVDDREIPSIFQAADLCVLPYTEIDQSGVLATALAFRKPLLLSDAGGFPEVESAGAARCFPAGDTAALREQLNEMLSSPVGLADLAEGAASLASGSWSWANSATAHLALYRRLTGVS